MNPELQDHYLFLLPHPPGFRFLKLGMSFKSNLAQLNMNSSSRPQLWRHIGEIPQAQADTLTKFLPKVHQVSVKTSGIPSRLQNFFSNQILICQS
jgi:hypothetical protein